MNYFCDNDEARFELKEITNGIDFLRVGFKVGMEKQTALKSVLLYYI